MKEKFITLLTVASGLKGFGLKIYPRSHPRCFRMSAV